MSLTRGNRPSRFVAVMSLSFFVAGLISGPVVVAEETVSVASTASKSTSALTADWPQWRGPMQQGIAPDNELPIRWSEESVSRLEIPGNGGSTPVVVGNVAYLTSGVDGKNHLLAIDVNTQKILWKTALGPDRGNKHRKGSGSNPSPVTDGKFVAAYFRSGDLACVDLEGKVIWQVNLQDQFGEDTLWWDLGSSPLLVNSMVVVPVMQTGPSYLVAYDLASGKMMWKSDRETGAPSEAAQSYSTPLAVTVAGRQMIAVMGADTLTLTATDDGTEVARLGGFNPDAEQYFRSIASPVAEGNLIICPYSRGNTMTAVDMEKLAAGAGEKAIVWFRDDIGSDVPTPAMRGGIVYVVSDGKKTKGTVYALSGKTGETLWEVELPRSRQGYSSSPLIAGDHLYVTGEDAVTSVIGPLAATPQKQSASPTVVSSNTLADQEPYTVASPVPMGGRLGLRTRNFFYVIGQ